MADGIDEETRQDIRRLLKGVRATTKHGGYEEIPEELVKEQARRIGLEESEIPEIRVEEGIKGAYIERSPAGVVEIVIPRRDPKWSVPETLRHELKHYQLGDITPIEVSSWEDPGWQRHVRSELEAEQAKKGFKSSDDICSVVLTLVLEEGFPKRNVTRIVTEVAKGMGYSTYSINHAKRWLKGHWKYLRELESHL